MTFHIKADLAPYLGADGSITLLPPDLSPTTALPVQGPVRPTGLPQGAYAAFGKRAFDLVLASIALVLSLPVLALLAAALWIESGNPFYFQRRLGRHGREFRMWKLRTMVCGADRKLAECLARDPEMKREWDLTQKLKRDPRVTPLGRFIRMTSLDELPQVINVLKGDMSLVGPRPMLPEQLPLYLYPEAYLALRPGITGLWQVTARNEEAFALRAVLDRAYLDRMSFGQDLRIIGATFGAVVQATGY
jgi:lipopolysaccharide/colanic/teichoic acid biosynthesis glycosyltransferase